MIIIKTLDLLVQYWDKGLILAIGAHYLFGLSKNNLLKNEKDNKMIEKLNETILTNFNNSLSRADQERKDELIQVKKLILNNSNMSTPDFNLYLRNLSTVIYFRIYEDISSIIEKNHINEHTFELTKAKVQNLLEKTFSSAYYELHSLTYDKSIINKVINIYMREREKVEAEIEEILGNYIEDAEMISEADRIKNANNALKEFLNYFLNTLKSNVHNLLNNLNSDRK